MTTEKSPYESLVWQIVFLGMVCVVCLNAYAAINEESYMLRYFMLWYFRIIMVCQIVIPIYDHFFTQKKQAPVLVNAMLAFAGFVGCTSGILFFQDVPDVETRLLWIATVLHIACLFCIVYIFFFRKAKAT